MLRDQMITFLETTVIFLLLTNAISIFAAAYAIAVATGAVVAAALSVVAVLAAQPTRPPWAPRCTVFPSGNVWNRPVIGLPVARDSGKLLASIGLHWATNGLAVLAAASIWAWASR